MGQCSWFILLSGWKGLPSQVRVESTRTLEMTNKFTGNDFSKVYSKVGSVSGSIGHTTFWRPRRRNQNWFHGEWWDTIMGRYLQGCGEARRRVCFGPHTSLRWERPVATNSRTFQQRARSSSLSLMNTLFPINVQRWKKLNGECCSPGFIAKSLVSRRQWLKHARMVRSIVRRKQWAKIAMWSGLCWKNSAICFLAENRVRGTASQTFNTSIRFQLPQVMNFLNRKLRTRNFEASNEVA